MKSNLLKLGLVGVLAATALSLTACSDEQVALGAGVLVGAAIVDHDHHSRWDRPYYRPSRPVYRPHRPGWSPSRPGRRWFDASVSTTNPALAVSKDVANAANHYGVSTDSAEVILSALKDAQKKEFTAIYALGFQKADLEAIARGDNPSASTLVDVSRNLGIEFNQAHDIIQTMKVDLAEGMN